MQAERGKRLGALFIRHDQAGLEHLAPIGSKGEEGLDLGQAWLGEGLGQQQAAKRPAEAASRADAGEEWHQRRFQRARQHESEVIGSGAEIAADAVALGEAELAMAERKRDAAAYLRHEADERQGPARRQHIEDRLGILPVQRLEQALGHDHIADPGGRDDEDAAGDRRRFHTVRY